MRQSRFTKAQIIGMIKEQEAGMPTAEVCRRHGLSPASFYKFKAKYCGMNISDTHRLKTLEDENAKLKRIIPDGTIKFMVMRKCIFQPFIFLKLMHENYTSPNAKNPELEALIACRTAPSG